jgi:uncharacterized membrane protein
MDAFEAWAFFASTAFELQVADEDAADWARADGFRLSCWHAMANICSPYSFGGFMQPRHGLCVSLSVLAAGMALAGVGRPAYAGWNDEGTSIGPQCGSADVNNSGVEVGNCLSSKYVRTAFVATTVGNPVPLAPLTTNGNGGVACEVGGINNAPTVSAVIVGSCQDTHSVWQAVYWRAGSPAIQPTQLQPLPGLAGLLADVKTSEVAVNLRGDVVGISINGNGDATPVLWNAAGVPTALSSPLLGSTTNCSPADINDASPASIVGNCPAGPGGAGKNVAVLWSSPTAAYTALPVPPGASYCSAKEINANGQIMGGCVYLGTNGATPDTYKTVQWGSGGTGPTVLQTINGNVSLRNTGVDMNASGQIAGTRLVAGGYTSAFFWDPSTGTNGIGIPPLTGGSRARAAAISDDGTVVGNGESNARNEAFVWHAITAALTSIPALQSGGNDGVIAISKSGAFIAGASETAHDGTGEEVDAVEEATP